MCADGYGGGKNQSCVPCEIGQTGFAVGFSALMGGIITWNHEYAQARDAGKLPWNWKASLTLQMVIFGAMMIALSIPFI